MDIAVRQCLDISRYDVLEVGDIAVVCKLHIIEYESILDLIGKDESLTYDLAVLLDDNTGCKRIGSVLPAAGLACSAPMLTATCPITDGEVAVVIRTEHIHLQRTGSDTDLLTADSNAVV